MTCIVGMVDNGRVIIGGDSAGVRRDMGVRPRGDEKVFENGDFLIGIAGSFRMGNILRYHFKPPRTPVLGASMEKMKKYMMTSFVDSVKDAFDKHGLVSREEPGFPGAFLVGYKHLLFEVQADYQVGVPLEGYTAIGCGGDYAVASMYSSISKDIDSKQKVLEALEAAEKFSGGVTGPFTILST